MKKLFLFAITALLSVVFINAQIDQSTGITYARKGLVAYGNVSIQRGGRLIATNGATITGNLTVSKKITCDSIQASTLIIVLDTSINADSIHVRKLVSTDLITGAKGITITGAVTSLNAPSNFATNINTGGSSGAVSIGGGSCTVAINGTGWTASTTGNLGGIGTITLGNSATIDNEVNNTIEFNENSDEAIMNFGSNKISWSSTDVTEWNFGGTVAVDVTPSLSVTGDADSDVGGTTSETITIDLTPAATPTNAVWDITSTQSAGYRFDKSVTIGEAAPNETLPALSIKGDADSDAADVTETMSVVLVPNATPTNAYWAFTSTQSAGYHFDKLITATSGITDGTATLSSGALSGVTTINSLTIANAIPRLVTTATAASDTTSAGAKLTAQVEKFVSVTSGSSAYKIMLPVLASTMVGMVVTGYVGSNGFNLRLAAADATGGTVKLNNTTGNRQIAVAANTRFKAEAVSTTEWIVTGTSNAGAAIATMAPTTF